MTKREVIEDLIKNTSGPVTIKYLARLSRSQKATVNCIVNDMQDELLVECIGKLDQERLYRPTVLLTRPPSCKSCREGIWPVEIDEVRQKIKYGSLVVIRDRDGVLNVEKVDKTYPYHCHMQSGHSYTWGEMVQFDRLGRMQKQRGNKYCVR